MSLRSIHLSRRIVESEQTTMWSCCCPSPILYQIPGWSKPGAVDFLHFQDIGVELSRSFQVINGNGNMMEVGLFIGRQVTTFYASDGLLHEVFCQNPIKERQELFCLNRLIKVGPTGRAAECDFRSLSCHRPVSICVLFEKTKSVAADVFIRSTKSTLKQTPETSRTGHCARSRLTI